MWADRPDRREQNPKAATGHNRLYDDLAYLWPIVSPPEYYREEARYWRDAIRAGLGTGRHRILELGAGGGHNLSHLTADFEAEAVDLSPRMLEHSRRLNPDVRHHPGDMRTVRLGTVFDGVLIHDAVSYMLTVDDLRAAFATARAHLRPGGLLLVAPDLVRENFRDGMVLRWPVRPPPTPDGIEVEVEERITDPDPTGTVIESVIAYTITECGSRRVETDVHRTGLFPIDTWVCLMEECGFRTQVLPLPGDGDGCGEHLFSGTLRPEQASLCKPPNSISKYLEALRLVVTNVHMGSYILGPFGLRLTDLRVARLLQPLGATRVDNIGENLPSTDNTILRVSG